MLSPEALQKVQVELENISEHLRGNSRRFYINNRRHIIKNHEYAIIYPPFKPDYRQGDADIALPSPQPQFYNDISTPQLETPPQTINTGTQERLVIMASDEDSLLETVLSSRPQVVLSSTLGRFTSTSDTVILQHSQQPIIHGIIDIDKTEDEQHIG
ncbi:unnamed protein product [Didymodactylos carnosus]|uniref:Uncharacterized protein n=1 Tax=Didymodactylos carnosus TaxID=1234261 RepID=A0A814HJ81_9BILA|nr:unnamed protein product [Didymodactylos carnosus]CAF1009719.1 unnamed protein product [Didymodactylos carnosus]CAF3524215.1 unnamed protein product [Didymodactylos carnosus]CAF3780885.1 unnamed protein product [Didymodactylos carnosus]